jgi:hypothetical protein
MSEISNRLKVIGRRTMCKTGGGKNAKPYLNSNLKQKQKTEKKKKGLKVWVR